jgi:hypothetical protein
LPVTPGRSQLKMKDRSPDTKDQLKWQWKKGAATTLAELGDPIAADPYALCVYDANGLRLSMNVPAGGICDGHPCWKANTKGFTTSARTAPRAASPSSSSARESREVAHPSRRQRTISSPAILRIAHGAARRAAPQSHERSLLGCHLLRTFQKITATDLQAKDQQGSRAGWLGVVRFKLTHARRIHSPLRPRLR